MFKGRATAENKKSKTKAQPSIWYLITIFLIMILSGINDGKGD